MVGPDPPREARGNHVAAYAELIHHDVHRVALGEVISSRRRQPSAFESAPPGSHSAPCRGWSASPDPAGQHRRCTHATTRSIDVTQKRSQKAQKAQVSVWRPPGVSGFQQPLAPPTPDRKVPSARVARIIAIASEAFYLSPDASRVERSNQKKRRVRPEVMV